MGSVEISVCHESAKNGKGMNRSEGMLGLNVDAESPRSGALIPS